MIPLQRRLFAEFIGTALLLATVVGSGIMGVTLADGNLAAALLANAAATAGMLYVLITLLGPISGAHFNPAVTLVFRLHGEMPTADALAYACVQIVAAIAGVMLAHAMFGLELVQAGTQIRSGTGQWLAEIVATFGLLLTILLGRAHKPDALPALIASYISAAYWFTASTSFANPAATISRALTCTFAGLRPADIAGFIGAQLAGALIASAVSKALVDGKHAARAANGA